MLRQALKGSKQTPFYIADLCKGSTIEFESICSGSSPLSATSEVMAMRGSRIAKQIIDEQRREARRKEVILELKKRLLKERGESNGERTESETNQGTKQ